MAMAPETPKRGPSQEELLLDYVRRLENRREGRKVAILHLSNLRPINRREQHIRAASNSFENLIASMQGQLFVLANLDHFFIFKDDAQAEVETVVQQIRFMFSDDPLFELPIEDQKFNTWYDVSSDEDYEEILHFVQDLVEDDTKDEEKKDTAADTRSSLRARQKKGDPMTPEVLDRVENALQRADLSNLVRRQFACTLDSNMVPEQAFSEMYISIADLRETMLPGVNMSSNRWLFQHLTEILDRRMLSMLTKTDHLSISGDISFNINVATLLSEGFQAFDDNIAAARRGSMILELQCADIFSDLGAYFFAREYVQDKGYRICLDGMSHESMAMIDRERLGVDMVKLIWNPEMVDGGEESHDGLRRLVRRTGANRIVLCRVDNREAIDFGQSVGITTFQGRYIENLIADDNRRRDLLKLKMRIERSTFEEEEFE